LKSQIVISGLTTRSDIKHL